MKIRADVAAAIRAGHSDTRIAHEVGCHRATVHRARQELRIPPVRVLDRVLAEAVPVPVRDRYREPLTPEQQAANLAELAAAIGPKPWNRRTATRPARKAS